MAISLWGAVRLANDRRRSAFCLLSIGLMMVFGTLSSLIIGCLPWDWWRCLHAGQYHGENQEPHRINVTQKCLKAVVIVIQ